MKLPEGQSPAHRRRPIWLLLALLVLSPTLVLAQTYTTIDCPDSVSTEAHGINDLGEIVGICDAGGQRGFFLQRGRFTMIDVPGAAEGSTAAFAINNRRDVVGRYVDAADFSRGFLLRNGRFTTIDVPGSLDTLARGIDDLGRIVGFYLGGDDVFRGFIRDTHGYRDIVPPGAETTGTGAFDISALGRIVGGYLDTYGVLHGYLLKKGVFSSIDYPGAEGTQARGINILGQVVGGWSPDPECSDCFTGGFLLTHRGFEEIAFPGALETVATGINVRGQIVGYYLGEDETFHGFLRNPEDD